VVNTEPTQKKGGGGEKGPSTLKDLRQRDSFLRRLHLLPALFARGGERGKKKKGKGRKMPRLGTLEKGARVLLVNLILSAAGGGKGGGERR